MIGFGVRVSWPYGIGGVLRYVQIRPAELAPAPAQARSAPADALEVILHCGFAETACRSPDHLYTPTLLSKIMLGSLKHALSREKTGSEL
jgi:hypothetical protein